MRVRIAATLLVCGLVGAIGCVAESSGANELLWLDTDGLRAKVSTCTRHRAQTSAVFFWPESLGGVEGDDAWDCVRHAEDCAAVLECAGYDYEVCAAESCEGNVATHCRRLNDHLVVAEHTSCEGDLSGNTSCSVVDDEKEGHVAFCHAGACDRNHCDGDTMVQCRANLSVRTDCAVKSQICVEQLGEPACVFPEPCEESYCTGNIVTLCRSGHVELEASCNDIIEGSECVGGGSAGASCVAPMSDPVCPTGTTTEWCDGGRAWVCLSGVRTEVNCSAIPGGSCVEEPVRVDPVCSPFPEVPCQEPEITARCVSPSDALE